MKNKFFATITAPNREKFFTLHTYDLDLITGTAKVKDRTSPTIETIITREEVDTLTQAGFSIKVKQEAFKLQAREKVSDNFQEWLRDMQQRKELP